MGLNSQNELEDTVGAYCLQCGVCFLFINTDQLSYGQLLIHET